MKNLITVSILAVTLAVSGCASNGTAEDPSPIELNKDDSLAMQVLKSGFDHVPFNIKDATLPEDAYHNAVGYGVSSGLGLLAGGLGGALGGFGLAAIVNAGSNPNQDWIQYIAWIPADNIDITDTVAIDAYVKENYFKPAVDAYLASDMSKNVDHPVELLDYANGTFEIKGEACTPIPLTEASTQYEECQMLWTENTIPVRYASATEGLPFKPSIKADRYIVVRIIDANYSSAGVLPFIKTDMMFAYVPSLGYEVNYLNRFAPNVVSKQFPYVMSEGGIPNFFIKMKK